MTHRPIACSAPDLSERDGRMKCEKLDEGNLVVV